MIKGWDFFTVEERLMNQDKDQVYKFWINLQKIKDDQKQKKYQNNN